MEEALATRHFLVEAVLDVRVDKPARKLPQPRYDKAGLQDDAVAQAFSEEFAAALGGFGGPEVLGGTGGASAVRDARAGWGAPPRTPVNIQDAEKDLNKLWAAAEQEFQQSAAKTLPTLTLEARRPWISAATLGLIQCRNGDRTAKDLEAEPTRTSAFGHQPGRTVASGWRTSQQQAIGYEPKNLGQNRGHNRED